MGMSIKPTLDLKTLEIKDPTLIKKYMRYFTKFFIPANEHDTFDTDLLESGILFKSSEIIGQHHPIEIAINESDPNPETSPYHIHLRIIDGRHRWKDAMKHGTIWACRFYNVKDYNQYMTLRGHFDAKKTVTQRERSEFFLNLCKYYHDVLGVELHLVCAKIVEDYSPPFHQAVIRHYVPNEFKNPDKVRACLMSVPTRHPMPIKTIQEKKPENIRNDYARFNRAIDKLEKEVEFLRAERGERHVTTPMYCLEELNGNIWTYLHTCISEQAANSELEDLDASKYRIKIVHMTYGYIYKETTDPEILKKRRQAQSKKKSYEKYKNKTKKS